MATIYGTSGNDTLNGTSLADLIFGFAGNDILNGNGGDDLLDGGTGADTMSGGTGSDIYYVDDAGDSVIEASAQGSDEVHTILAAYALTANVEKLRFTGSGSFTGTGNDSNNEIYGGSSNDTLYGGAGRDVLSGGTGADYMEGGEGDDVYYVDDAGDTIVETSVGADVDTVYTSLASYTLGAYVEIVIWNGGAGAFTATGNDGFNVIKGGSGNDTLSGLAGSDELNGNGGSDTLNGGDGGDLLFGGAGNDVLDGGAGADYMNGGSGDDVYYVDNAGDTIVETSVGADFDIVYTSLASYTLGAYVEGVIWNGGAGAFTATGNDGFNLINGGSGNDTLSGLAGSDELNGNGGSDTLNGGDGGDILTGGADNDVLDGGAGADYMVGGAGADSMTGGADADQFLINSLDSGVGAGADSISDFAAGTDIISLSSWDANLNVGGNQAFSFVGTSAFSGTAGELRYYFAGTDTWVQGDTNGDGVANFEIFLSGNISLAATDFVL